MGFEVLTAVVMKSSIFCDITDYMAVYPRLVVFNLGYAYPRGYAKTS
jgi:hypothetical protein